MNTTKGPAERMPDRLPGEFECRHCGEPVDMHDPECEDYEAPGNDNDETEAEWLDRRLGW